MRCPLVFRLKRTKGNDMALMTILGAKRSKGVLDNGTVYDSTKLYVQTAMKESPDQVGFATAEYAWGTSDNFKQLENQKFPLQADIELDVVTNGKSTQLIVAHVELLKATAPKAPNQTL